MNDSNNNFSGADDTVIHNRSALSRTDASSPAPETFGEADQQVRPTEVAHGGTPFSPGKEKTGSSAPGQSRANGEQQQDVIASSDAAVEATQAEHSTSTQATDGGCVVPGDLAQVVGEPLMNHPVRHRRLTTIQIEHGYLTLAKYEAAQKFIATNKEATWKEIRKATGVTAVQYCRWSKAIKKELSNWASTPPRSELANALAKKSPPGRPAKFAWKNEEEAAKVMAHNLQSNRTATAGSPQEAVKHAIKQGEISRETAAMLQQREADGKPILTEAMRRRVEVDEMTVRAYRTPRSAWLQYVNSPGSQQFTIDEETGEERMYQPGEWQTIDDATINLICTVPIERPGDRCWQNFGVMCGRFQFIVPADHRSYFIPGFSYTARPRSSYRAEDLTAAMQTVFLDHGMPRGMFLEKGISKSRLVHESLSKAGIKIKHVSSPHQKVIEMLFNKLWTKLSFLPGQTGRSRSDDEETTKLLMSCRSGATDPRKYFLPIEVVVNALHEAIAEHNAGLIQNSRYGRWVPREMWEARAKEHLRPLDAASQWMFSPVVASGTGGRGLSVKGFQVQTRVVLMAGIKLPNGKWIPGLNQIFSFGAQWLQKFQRAKVKLFFNPFLDQPAKVVLAQDFKGFKAETVLGDAEMRDRQARFNLRHLAYGEFPDIGLAAARQDAQALVRVTRSVRPDGKPGIVNVETRNMAKAKVEPHKNTAPVPQEKFLRRAAGMGVEPDEFERQAAKLARNEQRARAREKEIIFIDE